MPRKTPTDSVSDRNAAPGESAAHRVRQDQGDSWVRLCQFRVDSTHVVRGRSAAQRPGRGHAPIAEAEQPRGTKERKRYEAIHARGFCALAGDRAAEQAGIAAPVFHADGRLAAAVTLPMPTHRYDERHIGPVRAAAKEFSGQI